MKAFHSDETEDQMSKNASDPSVQPHLLEDMVQMMMQPGEMNWEDTDWILCRTSHSSWRGLKRPTPEEKSKDYYYRAYLQPYC